MPTDHACGTAADVVTQSLGAVRDYLSGLGSQGYVPAAALRPVDGAAGLLTFLDGLHAELNGTLTGWHSTVGHRIREVLGLPPLAAGGLAPGAAPRPSTWESLDMARYRAEEILTVVSARSRPVAAGATDLARRLELVEDTFAGSLRRLGVPAGESVDTAAGIAAATGSLFGMHPPQRPRAGDPSPAPPHARQPAAPVVTFPQLGDFAQGGMP